MIVRARRRHDFMPMQRIIVPAVLEFLAYAHLRFLDTLSADNRPEGMEMKKYTKEDLEAMTPEQRGVLYQNALRDERMVARRLSI
jgi:hypothetical protein